MNIDYRHTQKDAIHTRSGPGYAYHHTRLTQSSPNPIGRLAGTGGGGGLGGGGGGGWEGAEDGMKN